MADDIQKYIEALKSQKKAAREQKIAELEARMQSGAPSVDITPLAAAIEGIYGGSQLTKTAEAMAKRQEREQAQRGAEMQALLAGGADQGPSMNELIQLKRLESEEKRHQDRMKLQREKMKTVEDKGKQMTESTVRKVTEGSVLPSLITDVRSTIAAKKDLFGPIKGRIGSMNPYDTDAQSVDAQMRAVSQNFGRYMEGGVLRKEDEEKYRKMFPQLSDTPEVAEAKLAIVDRMLKKKLRDDVSALKKSGYDVSGIPVPSVESVPELPIGGKKKTAPASPSSGFLLKAKEKVDQKKKEAPAAKNYKSLTEGL